MNLEDRSYIALYVAIGPGLLSTEGRQHRRQRKMLNPVFSAAHLRHMNGLFHHITDKVRHAPSP